MRIGVCSVCVSVCIRSIHIYVCVCVKAVKKSKPTYKRTTKAEQALQDKKSKTQQRKRRRRRREAEREREKKSKSVKRARRAILFSSLSSYFSTYISLTMYWPRLRLSTFFRACVLPSFAGVSCGLMWVCVCMCVSLCVCVRVCAVDSKLQVQPRWISWTSFSLSLAFVWHGTVNASAPLSIL